MPDIQQQFNGGVIIYSDVEGMAAEYDTATVKAYSAACQALNALNRVRMEWQKTQRKQKDTPNA